VCAGDRNSNSRRTADPDENQRSVHSFRLSQRIKQGENSVIEKSEDAVVAKANLVQHLKNIDAACDDARLSAVEKIKRVKEEVDKAQECLKRVSW
jgi:hypothetical protein